MDVSKRKLFSALAALVVLLVVGAWLANASPSAPMALPVNSSPPVAAEDLKQVALQELGMA